MHEQTPCGFRQANQMETYNDDWVNTRVAETVALWRESSEGTAPNGQLYSSKEQQEHEQAYDEALHAVEQELQQTADSDCERTVLQDQIVAAFSHFSGRALGLDSTSVDMLTNNFLPVGTELAQWARQFDPDLNMNDIIQAARNAWTACGLQPLMGMHVGLTPSILGYSLLYPYSDNYLDDEEIGAEVKLQFSRRFRYRLAGQKIVARNSRERAIWQLIELIESQYPRAAFPQVFDCLLAIHQAQEDSISQLHAGGDYEFLRLSCAKGGTSVLADACLARGDLNEQEGRFAFEWGVLLQLGDDLQDLSDDMKRGSCTVFSDAVVSGRLLDGPALQLLRFSERVAKRMDQLPHGNASLKNLLETSWRSLIIRAIAESHEFFSPGFLQQAERFSPLRFAFLRKHSNGLASQRGLYAKLFRALTEYSDGDEVPRFPRSTSLVSSSQAL
jgi:hypothetical protein